MQLSLSHSVEDKNVSAKPNNSLRHGHFNAQKESSQLFISLKILDLCSCSLSKVQENILMKNLKFTHIPKRNLRRQFVEFTRKVRLIELFFF